jgi:hypothetical protein
MRCKTRIARSISNGEGILPDVPDKNHPSLLDAFGESVSPPSRRPGHGFAKPENRLKFYAAAEKFLAKHLGGRYEA